MGVLQKFEAVSHLHFSVRSQLGSYRFPRPRARGGDPEGVAQKGDQKGPRKCPGSPEGVHGREAQRAPMGGIQRGSMAAQMGSMMCRGARGAQVAEGVGFLGLLDCCTRPPSASSPGVAHRPQPRKFPFWADRRRRRCPAIARRRAVLGRAFATPSQCASFLVKNRLLGVVKCCHRARTFVPIRGHVGFKMRNYRQFLPPSVQSWGSPKNRGLAFSRF